MSTTKRVETPSDRCRICRCLFKVQFGNSSISSENLFKPSQRKGSYGTILANICRLVGVEVVANAKLYSDRVCNPCARKIRNLGSLFELINTAIEKESICKPQGTTPPKQGTNLFKRLLDTPPGKSPSRKTVRVNSPVSAKRASRKSLRFELQEKETVRAQDDLLESCLNIDDMPGCDLQVKVAMVNSSGNATIRIPRDDETKKLIRQMCNKNCQAAANTIVKHDELRPEIIKAMKKAISEEVADYLRTESILLSSEPDEIACFSNKIFLEELRVFCPSFYEILVASIGLDSEDVKQEPAINGAAFAAAILCRARNPKASAAHYRISTVLFHSGVKHEDLVLLNRLGVCMSPDAAIRVQRKMGEQLEGKVKIWKKAIEENKGALLLCEEIRRKQISTGDEDYMDITVNLQIDENALKNYESFSEAGYRLFKKVMGTACENLCDSSYTEECLDEATNLLRNSPLPLYRCLFSSFIVVCFVYYVSNSRHKHRSLIFRFFFL